MLTWMARGLGYWIYTKIESEHAKVAFKFQILPYTSDVKYLTFWTFPHYYKSIRRGNGWYSWCSEIQGLSELFCFLLSTWDQWEQRGQIYPITHTNINKHQINLLGKVSDTILQSQWKADRTGKLKSKYLGQEASAELQVITTGLTSVPKFGLLIYSTRNPFWFSYVFYLLQFKILQFLIQFKIKLKSRSRKTLLNSK